jgi:hypothetical protein
LALAVSFITTSISSRLVFNHLKLEKLQPEVDAMFGAISQLEGQVYGGIDESSVTLNEEALKWSYASEHLQLNLPTNGIYITKRQFNYWRVYTGLSCTSGHFAIHHFTLSEVST